MSRPTVTFQFLVVSLLLLFTALPSSADSKARVVRVSEVQGKVEVDRNSGQGYEKGFLNLPVTEGMKVRTGSDGRAELELEDSSTVRLTPDSEIEVKVLSLRDSGTKVSSIHLLDGTAYVNFQGGKDQEFTVTFVRESVALTHAAHLRMTLGDADATVAVFSGEVEVSGPGGTVNVAKNHAASFDLTKDSYQLAKNVDENPFDGWDKQQNQYQQRYADNSYSSYSPYAYGTSDLNYYGRWNNVPGYGQMWQPYFTGAGWDPYMNGAWTLFPGGYGWVSSYPWGWTPYNYGSWAFVPLYGWMWQPGGAWMGGYPLPVYFNSPSGFVPPRAPGFRGPRIVQVNRGSGATLPGHSNRIDIPGNSAGLGIPRGSIPNLPKVSGIAEQKGMTVTRVHTEPLGSSGVWRGSNQGTQRSNLGTTQGPNSGTRAVAPSSHSMSAPHASAGHSSGGGRR